MNIERLKVILLIINDKADMIRRSDDIHVRNCYYSWLHSYLDLIYKELDKE